MTNTSGNITAVLTGKLTLPLSPENISTIPLYHVHLNLWDTIVSSNGEPAIARLTDTQEGKVFRFEISPEAHFSNGRKIESDDIIFSVNRLLSRQDAGHFNVKSLLESITAISNTAFEIKLKKSSASFLFLLGIPEMGIVPKEACEKNGDLKTLSITSGAYIVEGKPQSDRIVLRKSPSFKRGDSAAPEKVTILFKVGADSLVRSVAEDSADFVELYESSTGSVLEKIKTNKEFQYKVTRPSNSVFLLSNPKNLKTDERLALSSLIHVKLPTYFQLNSEIEVLSHEMLPPKTFGSLDLQGYSSQEKNATKLPARLKLACYDTTAPLIQSIVKILEDSKIGVELLDARSANDYDLMLLGQGMNLDFPEIEFHLMMMSPWAVIETDHHEKEEILKAIHSSDRAERNTLIQKIGRSILSDARVIPLLVRSYVHVYRKGRLNIDKVTNYDGDVRFSSFKVVNQ